MTEDFTVLDKKFSKGDVIVMISDGLPEAPNKTGDLLDYEAVKNCVEKNSLKSAEEIKDELVKLSDNWLDGIHNPDDITIVVCKKLKDYYFPCVHRAKHQLLWPYPSLLLKESF